MNCFMRNTVISLLLTGLLSLVSFYSKSQDSALYLGGSGNYLKYVGSQHVVGGYPYSLEMWINPDRITQGNQTLSCTFNNDESYLLINIVGSSNANRAGRISVKVTRDFWFWNWEDILHSDVAVLSEV
jgi:hypothetical protein